MKEREIEYFYQNYLCQLRMQENLLKALGKELEYERVKLLRQMFVLMYEATEKLWNEMKKEGMKND